MIKIDNLVAGKRCLMAAFLGAQKTSIDMMRRTIGTRMYIEASLALLACTWLLAIKGLLTGSSASSVMPGAFVFVVAGPWAASVWTVDWLAASLFTVPGYAAVQWTLLKQQTLQQAGQCLEEHCPVSSGEVAVLAGTAVSMSILVHLLGMLVVCFPTQSFLLSLQRCQGGTSAVSIAGIQQVQYPPVVFIPATAIAAATLRAADALQLQRVADVVLGYLAQQLAAGISFVNSWSAHMSVEYLSSSAAQNSARLVVSSIIMSYEAIRWAPAIITGVPRPCSASELLLLLLAVYHMSTMCLTIMEPSKLPSGKEDEVTLLGCDTVTEAFIKAVDSQQVISHNSNDYHSHDECHAAQQEAGQRIAQLEAEVAALRVERQCMYDARQELMVQHEKLMAQREELLAENLHLEERNKTLGDALEEWEDGIEEGGDNATPVEAISTLLDQLLAGVHPSVDQIEAVRQAVAGARGDLFLPPDLQNILHAKNMDRDVEYLLMMQLGQTRSSEEATSRVSLEGPPISKELQDFFIPRDGSGPVTDMRSVLQMLGDNRPNVLLSPVKEPGKVTAEEELLPFPLSPATTQNQDSPAQRWGTAGLLPPNSSSSLGCQVAVQRSRPQRSAGARVELDWDASSKVDSTDALPDARSQQLSVLRSGNSYTSPGVAVRPLPVLPPPPKYIRPSVARRASCITFGHPMAASPQYDAFYIANEAAASKQADVCDELDEALAQQARAMSKVVAKEGTLLSCSGGNASDVPLSPRSYARRALALGPAEKRVSQVRKQVNLSQADESAVQPPGPSTDALRKRTVLRSLSRSLLAANKAAADSKSAVTAASCGDGPSACADIIAARAALKQAHSAQVLRGEEDPAPVLLDDAERLLGIAIESHVFDTFELAKVTGGHALSALAFYVLQRSGLISSLNLNATKLVRFLRKVEGNYLNNPYHGSTHAADVLQTLHVTLQMGGLIPHYADPHTLLACYLAAVVHDYEHLGVTNDYLINTASDLAIRYNDKAPMENHHLAAAFAVMRSPDYNFLGDMEKAEYDRLRKTIIDIVLATDMKQHFSIIGQFNNVRRHYRKSSGASRSRVSMCPVEESSTSRMSLSMDIYSEALFEEGKSVSLCTSEPTAPLVPLQESERLLSLQMAFKCADLGHIAEGRDVHLRWVAALEEEFFRQGDRERAAGLPISPLFDRNKPGVTKSQVGFFEVVALPLFKAFVSAFPGARPMGLQVLENFRYWKMNQATAEAP